MATKQLEVQIMGQSYRLGCPEGGDARLLDAVERVDSAMCRIRDAGKLKARDRIAVLAALNLAFDLGERIADSQAQGSGNGGGGNSGNGSGGEAPGADAVQPPTSPTDTDDARLAQLVQRLDHALAGDGRLL